jgi:hypothetical protein
MGVLDIQIASTSACSNAEQWADRRWWLQWFYDLESYLMNQTLGEGFRRRGSVVLRTAGLMRARYRKTLSEGLRAFGAVYLGK